MVPLQVESTSWSDFVVIAMSQSSRETWCDRPRMEGTRGEVGAMHLEVPSLSMSFSLSPSLSLPLSFSPSLSLSFSLSVSLSLSLVDGGNDDGDNEDCGDMR